MLASINPLGERGRNQHYAVTVVAYIVGATVAGALLGALLGLVGARVRCRTTRARRDRACRAHRVAARQRAARVAGARGRGARSRRTGSRSTGDGCTAPASALQLGLGFTTIVAASATWVAFACALFSGSVGGGLTHRHDVRPGALRCRYSMTARTREPHALHALMRRVDQWEPRLHVRDVRSAVLPRVRCSGLRNRSARMKLAAHRVALALRPGWEGRILRRDAAPDGEQTYAVVHLASFPLPEQRGDFGAGVNELMRSRTCWSCCSSTGPNPCTADVRGAGHSAGCAPTCSAAPGCSGRCPASSGAKCSSPRGSARTASTSWPGAVRTCPASSPRSTSCLEGMEILL